MLRNLSSPCGTALSVSVVLAMVTAGAGILAHPDEVSLLQVESQSVPRSGHRLAADVRTPAKHHSLGPLMLTQTLGQTAGTHFLLHVPGYMQHVSMNVSYHGFWEQLVTFPARKPREFNVILATCKTWLADLTVQYLACPTGTRWSYDWRRSLAFALFGCLYIGLTQWFLYVTIMTWLFPNSMVFGNESWGMKYLDTDGQIQMVGQVILDIFVFNVCVYFPVFYIVKNLIQGKGSIGVRIDEALQRYRENMWVDNYRSALVWVPIDFLIFAAPMYLRMPLEHCVGFSWTMFMSFTRGEANDDDKGSVKDKASTPRKTAAAAAAQTALPAEAQKTKPPAEVHRPTKNGAPSMLEPAPAG